MKPEVWALFCEISLWLWVASAVGLIMTAFPSRDVIRKRPAVIWGGFFLLFYAFWIVGMLRA
jgi:hypothetical protein